MPDTDYPRLWEQTFTIRACETDASGTAGAASVWRYLQEAAGLHASRLGMGVDDLLRIDRTWVLSRMRLCLFRRPAWRETIRVTTWPSGIRSLFASRGFAVFDAAGRVVAQAASDWIYLDLAARKPARPPEWLAQASPDPLPPLPMPDLGRLTDPPAVDWSTVFPVRRSEEDLNRHATNSAYVDWVLETVPDAFCEERFATDLELVFRASALRGEKVRCEAGAEGSDRVLHRLTRDSDGSVLVQARSVWAAVTDSR
jgi:acyl-ACP thioesterase